MSGIAIEQFDVVIAGAGPAGSSAAIRLAQGGLSVLLVEKKRFPREKLCGEFISPECLKHFEELGVMPDLTAVGGVDINETIFFAAYGKGFAVNSKWFGPGSANALGLSRAEMDARLLDRARDAGVNVREETAVTGLLKVDGRVVGIKLRSKNGVENTIAAKITIDATGRSRSLARFAENPTGNRKAAKYVAFKTHLRGARIKDGACEIYAYRGGYGGCNRVENGLYNLCFIASAKDTRLLGSDPERIFREIVFTNRRAKETMETSSVVKEWHAVPIERYGRGDPAPLDGLITIGDAAAFIDPFTGSGILLALESGRIASEAIVENFLNGSDLHKLGVGYRIDHSAAFDRRLWVCSMLRHAAFVPLLAEMSILALSKSSFLRRGIARATRFNAGPAA